MVFGRTDFCQQHQAAPIPPPRSWSFTMDRMDSSTNLALLEAITMVLRNQRTPNFRSLRSPPSRQPPTKRGTSQRTWKKSATDSSSWRSNRCLSNHHAFPFYSHIHLPPQHRHLYHHHDHDENNASDLLLLRAWPCPRLLPLCGTGKK